MVQTKLPEYCLELNDSTQSIRISMWANVKEESQYYNKITGCGEGRRRNDEQSKVTTREEDSKDTKDDQPNMKNVSPRRVLIGSQKS